MKKQTAYITILVAVLVAGWTMVPRMSFQPESRIWIEGTSTLHVWEMSVAQFDGAYEAAAAENVGSVKVIVPVAQIKSENGKLDKNAHKALKAGAHPTITYELTAADLAAAKQSSSFELKTTGKLTIAGVTKPVSFTVTGEALADGRTRYLGSVPVLMSDFDIKPPTAMLGTIKTGDKVVVNFDVVVAK